MKNILPRSLVTVVLIAALYSTAGGVTKNVDIVVTHSDGNAPVTTGTWINNSGQTVPAGTPVSFGQGFRRGDILPGFYPKIRNASTHAPLVYQWDQTATRRENNDDRSWRHSVYTVQLDQDVPPGGKYSVEFIKTAGTYSATPNFTLAQLCQVHQPNVHFSHVANQDQSQRNSGEMTFDICANANNTGRDAPRLIGGGPVCTKFLVRGAPVYKGTGVADPLIYVRDYLEICAQKNNPTAIGVVKQVAAVSNSWMNVAAGTTGNPGNPGSAGFANDPQYVIYYPEVRDGATVVKDWSQYATSFDASTIAADGGLTVPSYTPKNPAYQGGCLALNSNIPGMSSGTYFMASNDWYRNALDSTNAGKFHLLSTPMNRGTTLAPAGSGSGPQRLEFRICHGHFKTWYTVDADGLGVWIGAGSLNRMPFETAFDRDPTLSPTGKEQRQYWEQTGLVPPINLSLVSFFNSRNGASIPIADPGSGQGEIGYAQPLAVSNTAHGTGGGAHPDTTPVADWVAQWWLEQDPNMAAYDRAMAIQGTSFPVGSILNEATGRIPTMNNGAPVDPFGGVGIPYPGMGALYPQASMAAASSGEHNNITFPLENSPNPAFGTYHMGSYDGGLGNWHNDHVPAFNIITYSIYGDYWLLDNQREIGERSRAILYFGDKLVGSGHHSQYTIPADSGVPGAGHTFYAKFLHNFDQQGIRAAAWMQRNWTYPAALGPDGDPERQLFADMLHENDNLWFALKPYRDCSGTPANPVPGSWSDHQNAYLGAGTINQVFMMSYAMTAEVAQAALLKSPAALDRLNHGDKEMFLAWAGDHPWPTYMPALHGGAFQYGTAIDYTKDTTDKCSGPNMGGVSEYGHQGAGTSYSVDAATGVFTSIDSPGYIGVLTPGDLIKNANVWNGPSGPAEMSYSQWSHICNIDNNAHTFMVSAPNDPNCRAPFTHLTGMTNDSLWCTPAGGTVYNCRGAFSFRWQSAAFGDASNYRFWAASGIAGAMAVGVPGLSQAYQNITTGTGIDPLNPTVVDATSPSFAWDPAMVIPMQ